MLVNVRSVTRYLGRWLLAALIVPSALACSAPAEPVASPERAFVETPGGRRISFAAARAGESAAALSLEGEPFVIAKFDGRIAPAARRELLASGYREVAYLPYDALLLERPSGAPDRVVPGMVGFAPYTSADRLSRELTRDALTARAGQPEVAVMVHVMPGHDRAAVRAAVQARGGQVVGDGEAGAFGRLSVLLPAESAADEVRLLAERSDLFFVERIHRLGLHNDRLVGTMQSGQQGHDVAQTPIWAHGIRGENQIVGEIDTGIDANSCYFNDTSLPVTNTWSALGGYGTLTGSTHRKIVAYDFLYSCDQYPAGMNCETPTNLALWDTQGHGTHVAGNMVGDSDMSPATYAAEDAIAPAAKIVMQDAGYQFDTCAELPGLGCPVINLEPLFEQSFTQGARAHNNSYGDNEEAMPPYLQSNYTARTVDVDHFIWTHKDFLIINAAGNYGANNTDFSVGSPATMKNGLSIGSARRSSTTPSDENISAFSSRGWSADGRIKPDLMTPGYNSSAGNNGNVGGAVNCGTNTGGGTSYASPVATGVAALVRQYFAEGFYPSGAKNAADQLTPTAALVKATMINSGVSMTGSDNASGPISPIPSNEQGWGRIQLDRSLVFAGGVRKLMVDDHRATWAAGATTPVTYTVTGIAAGQQLKATLVWTDYPSVPDSPPAAQPTLDEPATWNAARLVNDLDLTVEGASSTYLGNVFTNGASSTGGTADRRNNVEQVLIASTTAGDYTITVTPFSIVQGGQDFALVVTWDAPGPGTSDGGTDAGDGASDAASADR
ncbi:MAG TPA: S8 family serine peptidase, partial [Polyangiaceae bacterium]|nr:S8 family serine peptidase [Polyangiaceae bacterium]